MSATKYTLNKLQKMSLGDLAAAFREIFSDPEPPRLTWGGGRGQEMMSIASKHGVWSHVNLDYVNGEIAITATFIKEDVCNAFELRLGFSHKNLIEIDRQTAIYLLTTVTCVGEGYERG